MLFSDKKKRQMEIGQKETPFPQILALRQKQAFLRNFWSQFPSAKMSYFPYHGEEEEMAVCAAY